LSEEDESQASEPDASSVTSDLDYYVVEYALRSQAHRVADIEQEFGVTVKPVNRICDEIVTVAFRRFNPGIPEANGEKARRAFLALYEAVYGRIVQRTVRAVVRPPMTADRLVAVIGGVYKERVFVSADPAGVLTLVGPFDEVTAVESFVLRQNAENSRPGDDGGVVGEFHPGGNSDVGPVSVFAVGGGRLTVKVYSADIARLPVDVVVNAANENLQNYAGVAAAIQRAGGEELRRDCQAIVEHGGPLKVYNTTSIRIDRFPNLFIYAKP